MTNFELAMHIGLALLLAGGVIYTWIMTLQLQDDIETLFDDMGREIFEVQQSVAQLSAEVHGARLSRIRAKLRDEARSFEV